MAQRSLVRTPTSKFLNTLLNNPELPTFIEHLETPTLNKLIEHVGPEDAGPLIFYTTDRQLRSILDESLWASLAPGKPETHRPEEFIRWLYVLQEQGETFLAERLVGLGIDYVLLNFAQLAAVNPPQAIMSEEYEVLEQYAGPAAYAEEFSGYYVTAVYDEEWDITRAALAALQAEDPDFLDHMLYRMSHDDGYYLMHDIAGDRRDSKESAGYVTPESARAFLELTRQTSLASLAIGENHDPVSRRYFSQLGARSHDDPASHASTSRTERNEPMFGPAGTLYVYRAYGIHWCVNIVTGGADDPQAVLIRGGIVSKGTTLATTRRGRTDHLADGPGKLCQALGIDGSMSGSLIGSGPVSVALSLRQPDYETTPRIGISKAMERPWRFVEANR